MSDETPLIFGDAAAAEMGQYPGRNWFWRKKKQRPPLTHCENCGAALTGRYCAQCGQPAVDYHRSFGSILADAADAFFNLDERFLKTFWLLLIKPWRLTNEFVEGKRVRYVHPLRVYLIASVLFFLVINFLSRGSHLQAGKTKKGETTINFAAPSSAQPPDLRTQSIKSWMAWATTTTKHHRAPPRLRSSHRLRFPVSYSILPRLRRQRRTTPRQSFSTISTRTKTAPHLPDG